jgi:hypothetical protein
MTIEQFIIVVFGLLPVWGVLIFGGGVLVRQLIQQVGIDGLASAGFVLVVVAVLTSFVALFVGYTCRIIHPTEAFEDAFLSQVAAAEKDVCELIKRADTYITNDVGKAGQDNPALLQQRLDTAHGKVSGGMAVCDGSVLDVSDVSVRMGRMEQTLLAYTQPVFTDTYGKTLACEISAGMVPPTPVPGPVGPEQTDSDRLKNIQRIIAEQRRDYLVPLDQKEADARKGHVSDCDKQRGANSAVDASNKMTLSSEPTPAPST